MHLIFVLWPSLQRIHNVSLFYVQVHFFSCSSVNLTLNPSDVLQKKKKKCSGEYYLSLKCLSSLNLMMPCSQTASCKLLYTISFQMPFLDLQLFTNRVHFPPLSTPHLQLNIWLLNIYLFTVSNCWCSYCFHYFSMEKLRYFLPFSLSRSSHASKLIVKVPSSVGVIPCRRKWSDNEL